MWTRDYCLNEYEFVTTVVNHDSTNSFDTFVTPISGSNDQLPTEKTMTIDMSTAAASIPSGAFSVQIRINNPKISHLLFDSTIIVTYEAEEPCSTAVSCASSDCAVFTSAFTDDEDVTVDTFEEKILDFTITSPNNCIRFIAFNYDMDANGPFVETEDSTSDATNTTYTKSIKIHDPNSVETSALTSFTLRARIAIDGLVLLDETRTINYISGSCTT